MLRRLLVVSLDSKRVCVCALSFLEHTIAILVDFSLTRTQRRMCQYLNRSGCKYFTGRDVVCMHVADIVPDITTTGSVVT